MSNTAVLTDNEKMTLRHLGGGRSKWAQTWAGQRAEGIVARCTPDLVARGLLAYDSRRWSGYKLTPAGRAALENS